MMKNGTRHYHLPLAITLTIIFLIALLTQLAPLRALIQRNLRREGSEHDNNNSHTSSPPNLPICPSMLMFTAPRHGSTWLVDSIEQCRFRNNGTYGQANFFAETWNTGSRRLLTDATPGEVYDYVRENSTSKLFPVSFKTHVGYVERLLDLMEEDEENVVKAVVLTRRAEDAYASWNEAVKKAVWNGILKSGQREEVVDEKDWKEFMAFKRNLERYFEKVTTLLKEKKVVWDQVRYDQVTALQYIVLERAGCYVRNCNFV